MKNAIISLFIVILVLIGFGAGYLVNGHNTGVSTLAPGTKTQYTVTVTSLETSFITTTSTTTPSLVTTTVVDTGATVTTTNVTPTNTSSVSTVQTTMVSMTITYSSTCTYAGGEPGPLWFRILFDSNQSPVVGAEVTAVASPSSCGYSSFAVFTTGSGAEWYAFPTFGDSSYVFIVTYAGQNYDFTASLAPLTTTCATLTIPSGVAEFTYEALSDTCSSSSSQTTTP